jgi:hypothetical protein
MPPRATAATTKASHPRMAVFLWAALQSAIRVVSDLGFIEDPLFPVRSLSFMTDRLEAAREPVYRE